MAKFLIVEDHEQTRRAIRNLLGDLGEVYECSDGSEAVSAYARCLPDWVLMDIRMKNMSGIAATKAIKAIYPDACIMIVTLYGDVELRERARRAGACEYVVKENLSEIRRLLISRSRATP